MVEPYRLPVSLVLQRCQIGINDEAHRTVRASPETLVMAAVEASVQQGFGRLHAPQKNGGTGVPPRGEERL
jgi:hypothetical protein